MALFKILKTETIYYPLGFLVMQYMMTIKYHDYSYEELKGYVADNDYEWIQAKNNRFFNYLLFLVMSPDGDTLEYGFSTPEMNGYILDRDKPTFFSFGLY